MKTKKIICRVVASGKFSDNKLWHKLISSENNLITVFAVKSKKSINSLDYLNLYKLELSDRKGYYWVRNVEVVEIYPINDLNNNLFLLKLQKYITKISNEELLVSFELFNSILKILESVSVTESELILKAKLYLDIVYNLGVNLSIEPDKGAKEYYLNLDNNRISTNIDKSDLKLKTDFVRALYAVENYNLRDLLQIKNLNNILNSQFEALEKVILRHLGEVLS